MPKFQRPSDCPTVDVQSIPSAEVSVSIQVSNCHQLEWWNQIARNVWCVTFINISAVMPCRSREDTHATGDTEMSKCQGHYSRMMPASQCTRPETAHVSCTRAHHVSHNQAHYHHVSRVHTDVRSTTAMDEQEYNRWLSLRRYMSDEQISLMLDRHGMPRWLHVWAPWWLLPLSHSGAPNS